MKKSKTEELNNILWQTENQYFDYLQENVLTYIEKEMTCYEAERCFSAARLFISKLRSSLSDEMIDSLCFACSYFARK